MNKVYCSNVSCAKPNLYEAAKPKFCAFCGQSFSTGGFNFAVAAPIQQAPRPQIKQSSFVPRIEITEEPEELGEFKFITAGVAKKITLRDVQNGGGGVPDQDRQRGTVLDPRLAEELARRKSAGKTFEGTEITE